MLAGIVFMVIATNGPLTALVGALPTTIAVGNGGGAPAVIVGLGLLYLLFSVGFTAMSRHVKNARAFYAGIVNGLGSADGRGVSFHSDCRLRRAAACPAPDDGLLPQSGAAGLLQCPSVEVGECADYLCN